MAHTPTIRLNLSDPSFPEIVSASTSGKIQTVRRLLASGVSVNERDLLGCTALIEAVSNGHVPIVELLLAHGADPNIADVNGITPLMEAAANGDLEMIHKLLGAGALVAAKDNYGDCANEYARAEGKRKVAGFLRSFHDPA